MMPLTKNVWVKSFCFAIVLMLMASGAMLSVGSDFSPVAVAGPDQTVMVGDTVQFDGSGSYDPYTPLIEEIITVTDISGNGEFIVAGWGTNVTFFKTISDVPLWTYDTGLEVKAAALSENGQYLAIGYANNVAFFDTGNPEPLWTYTTTYPIFPAPRESLDISRDGEHVAVGTGNIYTTTGDIYMFDRTGNLVWKNSYPNDVRTVRISGDGNYVVAGSWMWQLRLYDVHSGVLQWSISNGDPHYAAALSYNGSVVASGQGNANAVRVFNKGGTLLRTYSIGGHTAQMAMSDDGMYIAEAQYIPYTVNAFRLLRTDSITPVWTYTLPSPGFTTDMALNATFIVAGGNDANVYLFNKVSGTPLSIYPTGGAIREVTMDYGGNYYAGASASGLYVFATVDTPKLLWHWTNARPEPNHELAFSWDFGDGATGTGPTPTHIYEQPGLFIATLTVTSSSGTSAIDTLNVTVLAPATSAALVTEKVKLTGIDSGFTHTYYEWELQITVTNSGGSAAYDVVVYDVLPAELELLESISSAGTLKIEYSISTTRASLPPPTTLPVKSTHITWNVGALEPGQSETLNLKVCTRLNPAEKQEFTSPGIYVINDGAFATGVDTITQEEIASKRSAAITVSILELPLPIEEPGTDLPVEGIPPSQGKPSAVIKPVVKKHITY